MMATVRNTNGSEREKEIEERSGFDGRKKKREREESRGNDRWEMGAWAADDNG